MSGTSLFNSADQKEEKALLDRINKLEVDEKNVDVKELFKAMEKYSDFLHKQVGKYVSTLDKKSSAALDERVPEIVLYQPVQIDGMIALMFLGKDKNNMDDPTLKEFIDTKKADEYFKKCLDTIDTVSQLPIPNADQIFPATLRAGIAEQREALATAKHKA
jgi:hypothetical protein